MSHWCTSVRSKLGAPCTPSLMYWSDLKMNSYFLSRLQDYIVFWRPVHGQTISCVHLPSSLPINSNKGTWKLSIAWTSPCTTVVLTRTWSGSHFAFTKKNDLQLAADASSEPETGAGPAVSVANQPANVVHSQSGHRKGRILAVPITTGDHRSVLLGCWCHWLTLTLGRRTVADVLERHAAQGLALEGRRARAQGHGRHHQNPQCQQRASLAWGGSTLPHSLLLIVTSLQGWALLTDTYVLVTFSKSKNWEIE